MHGLIVKITATPGKRDDLIAILTGDASPIPGCVNYIVAQDPAEADAIWLTEVWQSKADHEASLALPSVRAAIARGRPMIANFQIVATTVPVGGYGLPTS